MRLRFIFIVERSNGSNVGNSIIDNEETLQPTQNFSPTNHKMCNPCVSKAETQLSDDRNNWAIFKMETAHYREICKLLDLSDRSKEPLLSALGCFDVTESDTIKQEFTSCGGVGTAKKALGRWGNEDRNNNVGALKKILKDKMKRIDVLDVIEKWEKLPVCHGCGVSLKP